MSKLKSLRSPKSKIYVQETQNINMRIFILNNLQGLGPQAHVWLLRDLAVFDHAIGRSSFLTSPLKTVDFPALDLAIHLTVYNLGEACRFPQYFIWRFHL